MSRQNKYPAKFKQADDQRREIQLIHIGAQQLGMDTKDESEGSEYRCMLWSVARVRSSSDLDFAGRKKVLDHLKSCGFKVRATGKAKAQSPLSNFPPQAGERANEKGNIRSGRALAQYPEATKIRALWLMLHELGAVKNPAESALAAYVKRMTGVDDLHWISGAQAETVIESLKKWAMRFLPAKVEALARECAAKINTGELKLIDEEVEVLRLKVGMAQSRGTFDPMQDAYDKLQKALAQALKG